MSASTQVREIAHDLRARLGRAGFADVTVRTALAPPWTSDWITAEGRRKLRDAGVAPPGPAPAGLVGAVPLTLGPARFSRRWPAPGGGSAKTTQTAAFSGTACKALYRCEACREPFEYVKDL